MSKPKPKKKQYYKIVNIEVGHHGYYYKVGVNEDPNPLPLKNIPSCGRGALYFVDKENLHTWTSTGSHIAWVEPISPIRKDQDGEKYKAHRINVTKILPIKKAVPLIFEQLTYDLLLEFGMLDQATYKELESYHLSLEDQYFVFTRRQNRTKLMAFLIQNKTNKKIRQLVQNDGFDFSTKEVKQLIAEGMYDYINRDTIDNLINDEQWMLLRELTTNGGIKFIKMIAGY